MNTIPFKPHLLLRNKHIQTIWRTFFSRRQSVHSRFERFELNDGDFLDIALTPPTPNPILLVLHGLEGSFDSPYVRDILHSATNRHWQAILMHFRGCSGAVNRTLTGYHSGETGDLGQFLKYLTEKYPAKPIYAVGYSLGGNVLLKYLGETQNESLIEGAVAVSVPYSLQECARRVHQGSSRPYGRMLLKCLQATALRKMRLHQQTSIFGVTMQAVEQFKTLREFDEAIIAPMWGFKNALDYYEKCSSKQFLKTITRPTLLIHAEDDPFLIPEIIPDPAELNPQIKLELSPHGGHVGFIQGPPWNATPWLDERILDFLVDLENQTPKAPPKPR